jgi:hypothetical protein
MLCAQCFKDLGLNRVRTPQRDTEPMPLAFCDATCAVTYVMTYPMDQPPLSEARLSGLDRLTTIPSRAEFLGYQFRTDTVSVH